MNPGTELDKRIAKEVFGLPEPTFAELVGEWVHHFWEPAYPGSDKIVDHKDKMVTLKQYSSSIEAAWEVLAACRLAVCPTWLIDGAWDRPTWWAGRLGFNNEAGEDEYGVWSDSAPLAICLAALELKAGRYGT